MMRIFNDLNIGAFVLLSMCLSLYSCNKDNDNFPKNYVGFEKPTQTVECERDKQECELQIKIFATDKSKKDRTVQLSIPPVPSGRAEVMKLTENKVTIKAGKKSVTTTVKIYPNRMTLKKQNFIISCIPQGKDTGISKLSILLKQK